MQQLKESCKQLILQIDKTVDLLVRQNIDIAMNELLLVIDLMTNTVEEVFIQKPNLVEKGIEVDEQHIINLLKQVVDAITNTDFVLVADLLNYEIKEILEEYIRKI